MKVECLADYPYVVLRVACEFCPGRQGRYRLARLVERFGADADLSAVLRTIAKDCPRLHARGNQYVPKCRATLPDVWTASARLPDLPPYVPIFDPESPDGAPGKVVRLKRQ